MRVQPPRPTTVSNHNENRNQIKKYEKLLNALLNYCNYSVIMKSSVEITLRLHQWVLTKEVLGKLIFIQSTFSLICKMDDLLTKASFTLIDLGFNSL